MQQWIVQQGLWTGSSDKVGANGAEEAGGANYGLVPLM